MYERNRQTHKQTPHDSIVRACKASRGKNYNSILSRFHKQYRNETDGQTDGQTDRQNCYINIVHQCADAR